MGKYADALATFTNVAAEFSSLTTLTETLAQAADAEASLEQADAALRTIEAQVADATAKLVDIQQRLTEDGARLTVQEAQNAAYREKVVTDRIERLRASADQQAAEFEALSRKREATHATEVTQRREALATLDAEINRLRQQRDVAAREATAATEALTKIKQTLAAV